MVPEKKLMVVSRWDVDLKREFCLKRLEIFASALLVYASETEKGLSLDLNNTMWTVSTFRWM